MRTSKLVTSGTWLKIVLHLFGFSFQPFCRAKMSMKIGAERVNQLKQFVGLCQANPAILNSPELAFFRDWLVR